MLVQPRTVQPPQILHLLQSLLLSLISYVDDADPLITSLLTTSGSSPLVSTEQAYNQVGEVNNFRDNAAEHESEDEECDESIPEGVLDSVVRGLSEADWDQEEGEGALEHQLRDRQERLFQHAEGYEAEDPDELEPDQPPEGGVSPVLERD